VFVPMDVRNMGVWRCMGGELGWCLLYVRKSLYNLVLI